VVHGRLSGRILADKLVPPWRERSNLLIPEPPESVDVGRHGLCHVFRRQDPVGVVRAVPQHHARPVLARVIDIPVLKRRADVFAGIASLVVVLDHADRLVEDVGLALRPQFRDIPIHHHVAIGEDGPTDEIAQVGDEVAGKDECIGAIPLPVEPAQ
jgi:hypothetical protein